MPDHRLVYRRAFSVAMLAVVGSLGGCHSRLTPPPAPVHDMAMPVAVVDMAVADLSMGDLALPAVDMACTPQFTNCSGLCGPVTDPCSGQTLQCGVCSGGEVCDLVTHQCVTPVTQCAPTQCGRIRNSCGARLTCNDCPSGQQCNPDTNTCETCVLPTCEQMGYQCGMAWLGCGSQTADLTDCGQCPAGSTPVCNPTFNVCEPACTPGSTQALCDAAHAATGVQCGVISDGCGGVVDCSTIPAYKCAAGFGCGQQGDANRCEPYEAPTECITAGKNCGTITSACTNMPISCGTCTAPQVCNANGVCGAPCQPKTCSDLSTPPQCGTVDDGCGGQLKCGDCTDSSYTCLPNNTCCKKKTCAADYAGQCGTALDDGCGGTLDCSCASGTCEATTPGSAGSCCVNSGSCAANSCNTSYTDSCTGQVVQCTCNPSTQWCNSATDTCQPLLTCAQEAGTNGHAPGKSGDACSNGNAFDAGGGDLISCPCTAGEYCISGTAPNGTVVTGGTKGTCCVDTACDNVHCGATGFTNTCTGASEKCGCASGHYCGAGGTCVADNTCATYGAVGQAGDPCSNGNAFDNGAGGKIKCACASGLECIVSGSPNTIASGSQMGTCCAPTKQSCGNNCNTTVVPDSCIGTVQTCTCNASTSYCGSGNTCVALDTCSTYGANGAPGDACGSESNGHNGTINCPCSTVNGYANNSCVNNVCSCTPNSCTSCGQTGQSDGCGGTMNCGSLCAGGTTCYPSGSGANQLGCCTAYSCGNVPNVPVDDGSANPPAEHPSCGTFDNGCGSSVSCGCPATNPVTHNPWPNVQCVPVSGSSPAYGFCECKPSGCNGTDPGQTDGCGHPINCNG